MKFKRVREKLRDISGRRQGSIKYELKADKGDYELILFYAVDKNFFLNALGAAQKKWSELKDKEAPDCFEVPERAFGLITGKITGHLRKIEADNKDSNPDFKIVSHNVNKAFIEKKGEKYVLTVEVNGICMGD